MMAPETSPFKPREARDRRERRDVDRVGFHLVWSVSRGYSRQAKFVPLRGDFDILEITGYAGCR